jgi:hypothetical protein
MPIGAAPAAGAVLRFASKMLLRCIDGYNRNFLPVL